MWEFVGQKCSNSWPNWLKCSPPNKGGGGDFLQPPSVQYWYLRAPEAKRAVDLVQYQCQYSGCIVWRSIAIRQLVTGQPPFQPHLLHGAQATASFAYSPCSSRSLIRRLHSPTCVSGSTTSIISFGILAVGKQHPPKSPNDRRTQDHRPG